jgi:PEP-CTERM motif
MKFLGLGAAALMITISASASSVQVSCSVAGANGANSFAATPLNCAQLTAVQLGSNVLDSVTIQLEDSWNGGAPQTNVFDFNYSLIDPDVALANSALPNTCVTAGAGSSTSCEDVVTGNFIGGTFYQLGNIITTDLAFYVGSGNFTIADVSANVDSSVPTSSLTGAGQLGSLALVTYTYSAPTTGAPEPGSMMLLGSGLLVAGLIGRKKFVRK